MSTATIDVSQMRLAAQQACQLLKALSNADRLMLVCQLSQGEKCVGELEEALGITQPTLSQQLGVLRAEGLVTTRRDGKFIFYTLGDPRVVPMLDSLQSMFCRQLSRRGSGARN